MLAGKNAFVCGYGDVGKGCAESLRENHCRVRVSEVDPICALQACMAGFDVGTVKDALKWAARTYLIAAISSLATLFYYVMIFLSGRRD